MKVAPVMAALAGTGTVAQFLVHTGQHYDANMSEVFFTQLGIPAPDADVRVLQTLVAGGFVPVVACIGLGRDGRLFNVNADIFAGHLAARLQARRLVIAGTTAGVLTSGGATVPELDPAGIARLMSDGTATSGMMAKLRACEEAVSSGVKDVVIVDGRESLALVAAALDDEPRMATRIAANLKSEV